MSAFSPGVLLVQLAAVGQHPGTPGIYAVTGDGELVRVISHGEYPRWSPDGKRFAYQMGSETWVANVEDRTTACIDRTGCFSLSAQQSLDIISPPILLWYPDGDHVVRFSPTRVPGLDFYLYRIGLAATPPGNGGVGLLAATEGSFVRRLSFTSTGQRLACETVEPAKTVGHVSRGIRLCDVSRKGVVTVLAPPAVSATVALLNPLWSPDGRWLAFDSLEDESTRMSFVMRWPDGRPVACPVRGADMRQCQVLEWAPDSRHLLFAAHDTEWVTDLTVLRVDDSGIAAVGDYGGQPVAGACWSPDGKHVASVLAPERTGVGMLDESTMYVADFPRKAGLAGVFRVPIPRGMYPVSFDW